MKSKSLLFLSPLLMFCAWSRLSAQYVALSPSATQSVHQPTGTTLSVNSLNQVLNPTLFSGADIGAEINNAILALPTAAFGTPCGTISIPAGNYQFTHTIIKPDCVFIEGNGSNLQYEDQTGAAIVIASPYSSANPYNTGGIAHLSLSGPGGSTTAIGLYMGGDPNNNLTPSTGYAFDQGIVDVQIFNFGVGVQMGSNSFLDTWRGGAISSNNIGVYFPCGLSNAGESYSFYGTIVNNGGVGYKQDCAGSEFKLFGGGVDYNASGAVTGAAIWVTAYGVHFEQNSAPFVTGGTGSIPQQLSLFGSVLYASGPGGSDPSFLTIGGTGSNVVLDGVTLVTGEGHSVSSIVYWQGNTGTLSANALNGATSPALLAGNTAGVVATASYQDPAGATNYSGSLISNSSIQGAGYVGSDTNSNGTLPSTTGTFPYNGTFLGWNADDTGGSDFYNPFSAAASSGTAFNWWANNSGAWAKVGSLSRLGKMAVSSVAVGDASWTSGATAPSGSCIIGSLYSNTIGVAGSTLYVCVSGAWVDLK